MAKKGKATWGNQLLRNIWGCGKLCLNICSSGVFNNAQSSVPAGEKSLFIEQTQSFNFNASLQSGWVSCVLKMNVTTNINILISFWWFCVAATVKESGWIVTTSHHVPNKNINSIRKTPLESGFSKHPTFLSQLDLPGWIFLPGYKARFSSYGTCVTTVTSFNPSPWWSSFSSIQRRCAGHQLA